MFKMVQCDGSVKWYADKPWWTASMGEEKLPKEYPRKKRQHARKVREAMKAISLYNAEARAIRRWHRDGKVSGIKTPKKRKNHVKR